MSEKEKKKKKKEKICVWFRKIGLDESETALFCTKVDYNNGQKGGQIGGERGGLGDQVQRREGPVNNVTTGGCMSGCIECVGVWI